MKVIRDSNPVSYYENIYLYSENDHASSSLRRKFKIHEKDSPNNIIYIRTPVPCYFDLILFLSILQYILIPEVLIATCYIKFETYQKINPKDIEE